MHPLNWEVFSLVFLRCLHRGVQEQDEMICRSESPTVLQSCVTRSCNVEPAELRFD